MSQENQTPNTPRYVEIPVETFDKLAGLLTLLQQQDPVDLLRLGQEVQNLNADLVALGNWIRWKLALTQAAHKLQDDLRTCRRSVVGNGKVLCHLCTPPKEIPVTEVHQHDIEIHGAYKG